MDLILFSVCTGKLRNRSTQGFALMEGINFRQAIILNPAAFVDMVPNTASVSFRGGDTLGFHCLPVSAKRYAVWEILILEIQAAPRC